MDRDIGRRQFITCVSGATAALVSACGSTRRTEPRSVIPTQDAAALVQRRPFGATGVKVSKLTLGGASVMRAESRPLLDEALRHGIDSWEFTAFTGRAFGEYFKTHPGTRERVFLSGKTKSTVPSVMQQELDGALAENDTSVFDFFAVHGVEDVEVLTDEVRTWAEKAKRDGKIRFFGFCTHKNVDRCLERGAGLGWIDGIQAFYNYRTQAIGNSEVALQRCHAKGIGIFTVKSMGLCVKNEAELQGLELPRDRLIALLEGYGLSFEQAKLKAIWNNRCVSSVCSLMSNIPMIQANAAAAADEHALSARVSSLLTTYANGTQKYFCRRCGDCKGATPDDIPIFNVMEALMYARSYGWPDLAKKLFTTIPEKLRANMLDADYSQAESQCPQKMPITQLVREACRELNG